MGDQPKKPAQQKQRSDRKTTRSCDTQNSFDEAPSKQHFSLLNVLSQPFVKIRQRNSKSETQTAVDRSPAKSEEDQDDMKTPPKESPPTSNSQTVTINNNEAKYSQEQKKQQFNKKRPVERKARSCESANAYDDPPNRQRFPRITMLEHQFMKSRNSPERAKSENVETRKKSSVVDRDKTIVKKEFPPKKPVIKKPPVMEKSDTNSGDSSSISVKKTTQKRKNKSEETNSEKTSNSNKRTETAVQTAIDRSPAKWWSDDLEGTKTPPIKESPPSSANSLSGLPITPNSSNEPQFTQEQMLNIKNFARQCEQASFMQLNRMFTDLPMPKQYECQAFKETRNKTKNRYPDIMCLDSSRVILRTPKDPCAPDYIHANKLQYPSLTAPCIITQGPLKSTCADFWRMIWQENTEAIFMLCKCEEAGRVKCEEYFHRCGSLDAWQLTREPRPSLYATSYDGVISISPLTQRVEDGIIITELKVYIGNNARRVSHYQCTKWSDYSTPGSSVSDSNMIFKLMVKMSEVKKTPNSIVVHCSAGIGRSGTLVALHMLWADFKEGNAIDVNKVVRVIRGARCQAVQTFEQYLFIHKFLLQMGQSFKILNQVDVADFYNLYEESARRNSR